MSHSVHTSSSVIKNTSYLTAAIIFQKLLAIVYFIFIARSYSNALVGEYTHALYITTIFGIFIELGLSSILTREVAKDLSVLQSYLSSILAIKFVAALLTAVAILIYVLTVSLSPLSRQMIILAGLVMTIDAFTISYYAVLRGMQRFQYEAFGIVLSQSLLILIGGAAIFSHLPIQALIGALFLSSFSNMIFSLVILKKKFHILLAPLWSYHQIKQIFILALPFLIAGVVMRVYSAIDIEILFQLKGSVAVSYYTAAYKIIFGLSVIPAVFGTVLYPAFARLYQEDPIPLCALFRQALSYMLMIALPIAVGTFILASELIHTIFTDRYFPSILILQILASAMVFIFLSFPVGALLNACHYQTKNTWMMCVTLIINVLGNLIFIPYLGSLGASIALIISSMVLFFGPAWYVKKILSNFQWKVLGIKAIPAIGAVVVMSLLLIMIKPWFSLFPIIMISGFSYFLALYFLGGISSHDVSELKKILFRTPNSSTI